MTRVLRLAAAILKNTEGAMLMVRKQGTDIFMQPGGKIDVETVPLKTS